MNKREELAELQAIKEMIESDVFKKFLIKPIKEEKDALSVKFFPKDLKDSYRIGGKAEGLQFFVDLLEDIDSVYRNVLYEVKSESQEDSTT